MKELIEFLRELAGKRLGLERDLMNRAALIIEDQAATIARYETTAENCDVLRAKVDEQAREIERLTREAKNDVIAYKAVIERQEELRAELAALKDQPSEVVPVAEISALLYNWDDLKSGDSMNVDAVRNWLARLNSSPVSAGDSALREAVTPDVLEWVRCGLAANNRLVDGDHPALQKLRAALTAPAPGECVAVLAGLHDDAERCAFVLENIGSMDAEEIDGDDIDLRFEDAEGRDTGCDVSIVEYAERGAKVIRALLAQHGKAVGDE